MTSHIIGAVAVIIGGLVFVCGLLDKHGTSKQFNTPSLEKLINQKLAFGSLIRSAREFIGAYILLFVAYLIEVIEAIFF